MTDLEQFCRDRLEALRSLDEQQILAYARKYGVRLPSHPEAFWRGIHKARVMVPGLSEEEREHSRRWLREHDSEVPA